MKLKRSEQLNNYQGQSAVNLVPVLQPADVIIRSKSKVGLVDHYGLYLGDQMVMDNHPDRGVTILPLAKFLNGNQVKRIKRYTGSSKQLDLILTKANSMLGRKYDLLGFNCEHFVNEALGAGKISDQIKAFGILSLFLIILSVVTKFER